MFNKNIRTCLDISIILLSLITTIFFCASVFHYSHIITFNGPIFGREIDSPAVAVAWLNGLTPYSDQAMPAYTDVYGIINVLAAMPFLHFVDNIFLPFRAINLASILAVSFLIFWIIRKFSNKKISDYFIAALFALPIIAAQLTNEPFIAKPDSLGFFLYWLAIFLPILLGKNSIILLAAILIGLLAFLTKPYFMFAPIFILLVGFINDFKSGLKLSITFTTVLALTEILLNKIFPWYWWNTFWVHYSYSFDYRRVSQLPETLNFIAHQHSYFFLALGTGLVFLIISQSLKFKTWKVGTQLFKNYKDIISESNYIYLYLLFAFIPTLRLESSAGGMYIYFFHIYFPALVICTYLIFKKLNNKFLWMLVVITLNIQIFTYASNFIYEETSFPASTAYLTELDSYISKNSGEIFADSNSSALLSSHNLRIYDAGQNEYFAAPFQFPKSRKILLKHFPHKLEQATKIYENHWSVIKDKINNKTFSMIILQTDISPSSFLLSNIPSKLFSDEKRDRSEYFRALVEKNYKKIATIKMSPFDAKRYAPPARLDASPLWYPSLDIWVPRNKV